MDQVNLSILIEAAKFIELKTNQSEICDIVKSPQIGTEMTDTDDSVVLVEEIRRKPDAGIRECHKNSEKHRRSVLRKYFEIIKMELPTIQDDKKSTNINILHNAIKYIDCLRRKELEYEHELDELAREKITLLDKFALLKKEFPDVCRKIDLNTWIPKIKKKARKIDDRLSVSNEDESRPNKSSSGISLSVQHLPTAAGNNIAYHLLTQTSNGIDHHSHGLATLPAVHSVSSTPAHQIVTHFFNGHPGIVIPASTMVVVRERSPTPLIEINSNNKEH